MTWLRFVLSILVCLMGMLSQAQSLDLKRVARELIPSGDASTGNTYVAKSNILDLRTRFRTNGPARSCWDLPLSLDLSQSAGIRLRFRCLNADLASQLNLYLQVDGVWYCAPLAPRTSGLWEEIVISKAAFCPENGAGASWRKVERMRLAAWRGAPGDYAIQLAAVEFLKANVSLALVRCGVRRELPEATRQEEGRYAQLLGNSLVEGGIHPAVIDEADVTLPLLKSYSCVVLPNGENAGENVVNQLGAYLRQDGRIMAFYSVPPRLANLMRLPAGKFMRAASLPRPLEQICTAGNSGFRQHSAAFLAVTSQPGENLKFRAWWVDAAGKKTKYPAIIQCPYGFWMTHVYLGQDQEHAIPTLAAFLEECVPGLRSVAAGQLLQKARFAIANGGKGSHETAQKALERAVARQKTGDYPGVVAAVNAVFGALADEELPGGATVAGGKSAPANEMRGVWLRSATGLPGETWGHTLRRLKLAQYNAIFPHLLSPYAVAWSSQVVGRRMENASDESMAALIAAAENLKIQVHAWFQVLNMTDAPEGVRKEWASKGRFQRKSNGNALPWLCPTQRENRLLLVQLLTEFLRKYPVAGVQFDMLRYEGSGGCYCEHCKAAFARYLGHPLKNWPECTKEPAQEKKAWEAFRRHQITQLASELAEAARRARPRVKVSAAVYSNLDGARTSVGQDWREWLQKDIVDFVCPMDYRSSTALFQGDLARQKSETGKWADKIRPGIGVTVNQLSPQETQRQIQAARNAGLDGFVLFELTARVASDILK